MNYLLDTNVISELIAKQPNPQVVAWIDSLDPQSVYLSVITIGEIQKGLEKLPPSRRKEAVRDWLHTDLLVRFEGRIAPITTAVMLVWGSLAGQLEKQGRPLAAIDSLVAAISIEGEFALVTRNEADFANTGVTLFNPWNA